MAIRVRRRDRISELPEAILHHILSFLSLKEVIKLGSLSKTWKRVSATHPVLKFNRDLFGEADFTKFQKLLDVGDRILKPFREERLSIHEFELDVSSVACLDYWPSDGYSSSRIDQWIGQAVSSNVEILTLSTGRYRVCQYTAPQCVFLAKSVVTLTLQGCRLPPMSTKNLPSLKKLSLCRVKLSDDQLPQDLFADIEDLTMSCCSGGSLKTMEISGPAAVKLKKLVLWGNRHLTCVHIEASSLIEASFRGRSLKVVDTRRCENLRCITLHWTRNNMVTNWLDQGLNYYPTLETLRLYHCNNLKNAKVSSTSLKSLVIYRCCHLAAVNLNTPNLSRFEYTGRGMEFSPNVVSALASCCVTFWYFDDPQKPLFLKLRQIDLLSKLDGWAEVKVAYLHQKFCIIPRQLRKVYSSPLYNVKQLEITIIEREGLPLDGEVIDSLLWISPHLVKSEMLRSVPHDHQYTFKYFRDNTSYNM